MLMRPRPIDGNLSGVAISLTVYLRMNCTRRYFQERLSLRAELCKGECHLQDVTSVHSCKPRMKQRIFSKALTLLHTDTVLGLSM